ncbi:unnamed protein product [Gadus morhua 'NCC']
MAKVHRMPKNLADRIVSYGTSIPDADALYEQLERNSSVNLYKVSEEKIKESSELVPPHLKAVPGTMKIHQGGEEGPDSIEEPDSTEATLEVGQREVVPLLWSSGKTSRPLAPNRTTQSDHGTHFGLRRDVVPLLWSYRKTSRPLAPNRTTQPDHGTHFGLRRDVVPLLWSYRKTSRPLAPNRTTQSDHGTHFGLRRDVVPLLWSYRKTSRPLAPNRTIQSD